MSIQYGENVFRSVELPLIRALLDVLPLASNEVAGLHDVEKRDGETVGAEEAGSLVDSVEKTIWDSFETQRKYTDQNSWRNAISEDRLNDAVDLLKADYAFSDTQAASAVAVFQTFIPTRKAHG